MTACLLTKVDWFTSIQRIQPSFGQLYWKKPTQSKLFEFSRLLSNGYNNKNDKASSMSDMCYNTRAQRTHIMLRDLLTQKCSQKKHLILDTPEHVDSENIKK
jgi:hypothetical protein